MSGSGGDFFQRWLGGRRNGSWVDVVDEMAQPSKKSGPSWRVIDRDSGRAATVRADDGDNAICWPIRYSLTETAGAMGNVQSTPPGDDDSVPAVFASGQSVQNADIVIWYIAKRLSLPPVVGCGPRITLSGY